MKYMNIVPYDFANGEGVRTSLFVSGCDFHCDGCFNKEAQDFDCGKEYTADTKEMLKMLLKDDRVAGLSILGGDPLCQDSAGLVELQELCLYTQILGKTVWLWSGYTWEQITQFPDNHQMSFKDYLRLHILDNCDVFVDGVFKKNKKDVTLPWRGSSNQRVIDVQKSFDEGKVILYEKG